MKPKFIANVATKNLHSLEYADGRCKLSSINEEHKREFCTLEEALAFPGTKRGAFQECGFCMPKYRRANKSK